MLTLVQLSAIKCGESGVLSEEEIWSSPKSSHGSLSSSPFWASSFSFWNKDWVSSLICKKPFRKGALSFGCGQCLPCRINKRRIWKNRIVLESFKHADSCFVTLTYSDEFLPAGETLVKKHYQDWLKRLRDTIFPNKVRFYLVGEYGDRGGRPHYHAILFGLKPCLFYPFKDPGSVYARRTCSCSSCRLIRVTWEFGHTDCGVFDQDSANYVCGYVTKKMTRERTDVERAYLRGRCPEFARMSLKPGIGADFMEFVARSMGGELIDDDVPGLIRVGGEVIPLGRYLRERLRVFYGLSEKGTPDSVLSRLSQDARDLEEIARSEFISKGGSVQAYYNREKAVKAQKILNIETRFNIFKKGSL